MEEKGKSPEQGLTEEEIEKIKNSVATQQVLNIISEKTELDKIMFRVNSALLIPNVTLFAIAIPLISSSADTLYSPIPFLFAILTNATSILLCSILVYSPIIRQYTGIHNRKSKVDQYAQEKGGATIFSKSGKPLRKKKMPDFLILQVASCFTFLAMIISYTVFALTK